LLGLSVLMKQLAAATAALSAGRQEGGVMAEAVGLGNIRAGPETPAIVAIGRRELAMGKALGAKAVLAMTGRILGVIVLAALIAGCDHCGDWWGAPDRSQSCKGPLPAQP
jgi:hypothetical protein